MIGTENFFWKGENYCDSQHLRGKIDGFLRDGNRTIINRNTSWSRCDICVQKWSIGSAGPGRPGAPTDSEDFVFLERASPTPTWILPLVAESIGGIVVEQLAFARWPRLSLLPRRPA